MIRTKGIVVPVDWNEDGLAVAFAVSTFDEDQYALEGEFTREAMLKLVREEVEVTGILRVEGGKKVLVVDQIRTTNPVVAQGS